MHTLHPVPCAPEHSHALRLPCAPYHILLRRCFARRGAYSASRALRAGAYWQCRCLAPRCIFCFAVASYADAHPASRARAPAFILAPALARRCLLLAPPSPAATLHILLRRCLARRCTPASHARAPAPILAPALPCGDVAYLPRRCPARRCMHCIPCPARQCILLHRRCFARQRTLCAAVALR